MRLQDLVDNATIAASSQDRTKSRRRSRADRIGSRLEVGAISCMRKSVVILAVIIGALATASVAMATTAHGPYGAIASTAPGRTVWFGWSHNYTTLAVAEGNALAACASLHRGRCYFRVAFWGRGECAAIAKNGGRLGWASGRSIAAARHSALDASDGGFIMAVHCNG